MKGFNLWLRGLLGKAEAVDGPPLPDARPRSDRPPSFAEENNEFALALYGQVRRRPCNLIFSPFSIRTVLAMSQAGARGETSSQMRKALCMSSSEDTQHAAFAETVSRLSAAGGGNEMAVANSLWGQIDTPLRPAFLDLIARQYGGTMNAVDFRHGAEAARLTMNQWVEDKTRQKIRDVIPSGSVDATTRFRVHALPCRFLRDQRS